MKLDKLKSLTPGDIVVITKVDEGITKYFNYQMGNELIFVSFNAENHFNLGDKEIVNFTRVSEGVKYISHFSYDIRNYIELKSDIREKKLKELGI